VQNSSAVAPGLPGSAPKPRSGVRKPGGGAKLPLRRPLRGRWLAGVCTGIAQHIGVRVLWVRIAMLLFTLVWGAGIAAYVLWWITIPTGDPLVAAAEAQPVSAAPLAKKLAPTFGQTERRLSLPAALNLRREIMIGVALLTFAVALMAVRAGWNWQQSWVPPVMLAIGGLAIAWTNASPTSDPIAPAKAWKGPGWVRLLSGLVLVVAGLLVFSGQGTGLHELISVLTAMLIVVLGVALVLAPWWVRLVRATGNERKARIREAERADIAAHLHDSVLQTLTLIRANADDGDTVARLARTQERELREWLYADRPASEDSLATQMRALVAQVEDGSIGKTGVPATAIDVVVVGDCPPTDDTAALLSATREALVNAVTHGRPPVSVYLEVSEASVQVFVRDRGDGFSLAQVSPDRLGVRNSILARMQRRGGSAEIVSRPSWGTEVRLKLFRSV